MLGEAGKLPEIYSDLEINYFLLRRLLGVKTEGDKKAGKVRPGPARPARRGWGMVAVEAARVCVGGQGVVSVGVFSAADARACGEWGVFVWAGDI